MLRLVFVMLLGLSVSQVFAQEGLALSLEGNGEGALACVTCHGAQGEGMAQAGFPRLAGLNAAYIEKQLNDFASGLRANPVMQPTASALSQAERQSIARYYSALAVPAQPISTLEFNAVGEKLALRGRWDVQLPACVQCHGPKGVGVGEHFPPLAGQSADYLASQLRQWQGGTRANDPLGLMKKVADNLSEDDIVAVARWFANQPSSLEGEK